VPTVIPHRWSTQQYRETLSIEVRGCSIGQKEDPSGPETYVDGTYAISLYRIGNMGTYQRQIQRCRSKHKGQNWRWQTAAHLGYLWGLISDNGRDHIFGLTLHLDHLERRTYPRNKRQRTQSTRPGSTDCCTGSVRSVVKRD
jgi:hypothetical protein